MTKMNDLLMTEAAALYEATKDIASIKKVTDTRADLREMMDTWFINSPRVDGDKAARESMYITFEALDRLLEIMERVEIKSGGSLFGGSVAP